MALREAKTWSSRSSSTACEPQAEQVAPPPRRVVEIHGAAGLRVGLATLYYAPLQTQQARRCHALGCALLAWCAAADRLRRALPWQTEVLVLEAVAPHGTARSLRNKKPSSGAGSCAENTARLPHDCPGAVTLRPSAALVAHVAAHVAAQVRRQPQRRLDFLRRMGGQLYKWELFSLTRLDAVLFADLDVDLFPPRLSAAAVAAEWAGRAAAGDLRRAAAHPPRRSARLFLAHKRRPLPPAALGGALPRRPARPRRGLRRANRLEPQRHPR